MRATPDQCAVVCGVPLLIVMRRLRSGALAARGSITLSTQFLNEASALSSSTADGRTRLRLKRP